MQLRTRSVGYSIALGSAALVTLACSGKAVAPTQDSKLLFPGEVHFKNIQQLTAGGTNAEAYWSFDGEWLSYQHKGGSLGCDQIFRMRPDGSDKVQVSLNGRTTCAYYTPNDSRIIYSSTVGDNKSCPAEPDHSRGYVWPIYDTYQFYTSKPDGTDPVPAEPGAPRAYNAEATVCKDGSVVFTSDRDGDLDLYVGKLDTMGTIKDVKRVTNTLGYDGGAFFSQDCKKLVWRASRPKPGKEADEYKALLKQHLVRPSQLEIWVGNADGSHARQITRVGAASFAPYFTPDAKRVLFASNPRDPRGRHFDIYMINVNGTGLERVTFSNTFESFPMFSPDGKRIAFSSNRNASVPRETNVFVADWVETPARALTLADSDPADRFQALVDALSVPAMDGRGIGTQGLAQAEKIVTERMAAIGLKPFFEVFKNAQGGEHYAQKVEVKGQPAHNLLGAWGKGCGKPGIKSVLIGAHLDHLGYGSDNSLEPTKKGLHPGADDNASGVAGVLEAARIITATPKADEKSCYVFAAFTGEEHGIAGSSRMVEMMKKAGALPKAMLNLDMVGRLENNRLTVFGTATAKEWPKWIEDECIARDLTCPGGGDGYGPSDHMSFYIGKVPVLHFFTGPHVDYHRTTDTSDKINATGGVQTAEVVAAIALRAGKPGTKLHYLKAKETPSMGLVGRARGKSKGAYLGTIPDYSALSSPHGPSGGGMAGGGVRLAGARPGSPADKAGVKEGDILFSIDTQKIASLEDFMKILSELEPDQKITIVVKRGDGQDAKFIRLPAVVGRREVAPEPSPSASPAPAASLSPSSTSGH